MLCRHCGGAGKLAEPPPWNPGGACFECAGSGWVPDPKPARVRVEWGSASGEGSARLPGIERFVVGVKREGRFPVERIED